MNVTNLCRIACVASLIAIPLALLPRGDGQPQREDLPRSHDPRLVVEQFAAAVLDVADTAAVMVNGRVVLTGTPAEVEKDLSDVYLGGEPPARLDPSENPLAETESI